MSQGSAKTIKGQDNQGTETIKGAKTIKERDDEKKKKGTNANKGAEAEGHNIG